MNKLLDIDELSALLGRSVHTIKKDLKQNPLAVPPRVHLPGTRLLRWRPQDVDVWLEKNIIGGSNA
jgi:predicted DNA-binding transcriptional regulator AlpA